MRTVRRLHVVVALVALLAVGSSGVAQAAKPQTGGAGTLEVYRSSTSQVCSNLGYLTTDPSDDRSAPDGAARCEVNQATANEATKTLAVDTAMSTATPLDPTGVSQLGQGRATSDAWLYFTARLGGKPASKVAVSVPLESVKASSEGSVTTTGFAHLLVYAYTWNPYTTDGGWELLTQSPIDLTGVDEARTVDLVLEASRLKGDLRLAVAVSATSRVGVVQCADADNDRYCDPGTITTRDGSGSASSTASVRIGTPTFVAS